MNIVCMYRTFFVCLCVHMEVVFPQKGGGTHNSWYFFDWCSFCNLCHTFTNSINCFNAFSNSLYEIKLNLHIMLTFLSIKTNVSLYIIYMKTEFMRLYNFRSLYMFFFMFPGVTCHFHYSNCIITKYSIHTVVSLVSHWYHTQLML